MNATAVGLVAPKDLVKNVVETTLTSKKRDRTCHIEVSCRKIRGVPPRVQRILHGGYLTA